MQTGTFSVQTDREQMLNNGKVEQRLGYPDNNCFEMKETYGTVLAEKSSK